MSERNELAEVIKPAAAYDFWPQKAAELALAAGYRKPRIISTAEELDGLACGSVFRDDNERIWEVEKIGYGGVEKALSAMGIGSMLAFHAFRGFPATVLYEPTR